MSNLTRIYIHKPELLNFEIQHFRDEYVCWFSGPYFTLKTKFSKRIFLKTRYHSVKFSRFLSSNASVFYQTRHSRYVAMFHKHLGLLNIYLQHWILGTTVGFKNALRVRGVGYRFDLFPTKITIQAGNSHLLRQDLPCSVSFQSLKLNKKSTLLSFKTSNLVILKNFLSTIRNFHKPDIYKGKGIRYKKEFIYRKEGKKKKTT